MFITEKKKEEEKIVIVRTQGTLFILIKYCDVISIGLFLMSLIISFAYSVSYDVALCKHSLISFMLYQPIIIEYVAFRHTQKLAKLSQFFYVVLRVRRVSLIFPSNCD